MKSTAKKAATKKTQEVPVVKTAAATVQKTPWEPIDPDVGNGRHNYSFVITKQVQMMLLVPKILEAIGHQMPETEQDIDYKTHIDISTARRNLNRHPSRVTNPMTLFLSSVEPIDTTVVQKIIDDHDGTIFPDFSAPPSETTGEAATSVAVDPGDDADLADVVDKLQDGKTLTTAELSALLRKITS